MGEFASVLPEGDGPLVFPGVSFNTYRGWDAVNSSRLNKLGKGSMRHFFADHSESTSATNLGRVYHSLVLTPALFAEEYVLQGQCSQVTARGSQCSKKAQVVIDGTMFCTTHRPKGMEPDGVEVVTGTVWDQAHRMMEATLELDMASFLLDSSTERELAYVWTEDIDLKTTRDINPDGFRRSILRYGYHRQAAFYFNGALGVNRARKNFYWIAQESVPPYDTVVYQPGPDMISQAAETLYRWLSEIGECRESDQWPGFGANGSVTLFLPEWMNYEEDE
jgi:hypothetical protein